MSKNKLNGLHQVNFLAIGHSHAASITHKTLESVVQIIEIIAQPPATHRMITFRRPRFSLKRKNPMRMAIMAEDEISPSSRGRVQEPSGVSGLG